MKEMSAPPPPVEQLPEGNGSDSVGFTIGGTGPVKTLNSKNKSGSGAFDMAAFVNTQAAPLVVVKYEADFCNQCKTISPLFERLAAAGPAHIVACFSVDVGVNEDIGEASEITNLPTFKFLTTKLSPTGELLTIDVLVGADAKSLQDKFVKGVEVVSQLVAPQQRVRPLAPQHPQQTHQPMHPPQHQQVPPHHPQVMQPSQPRQQQQPFHPQFAPALDPRAAANAQIKRELADIRTVLLATVQRVEKLYHALN